MDLDIVATFLFVLLLFAAFGGIFLFLQGRKQKVRALRRQVEAQGWQWLSGNSTDFALPQWGKLVASAEDAAFLVPCFQG